MDKKEVRRTNLRAWVKNNGTPVKEKSFFSQILSGDGSFGERAARRLEIDYKMGAGYLDSEPGTAVPRSAPDSLIDTAEILKLITLYTQSTAQGRIQILDACDLADKIPVRRLKSAED